MGDGVTGHKTLMVPMRLDALLLAEDAGVVAAMADFSRLPYTDGTRDHHPDVAYLSDEVVRPPFENPNLQLRAGVHLHWALPRGLTRGFQTPERTVFPAVPNRWLVTRTRANSVEQQWVVESDYVFPPGTGEASGSVTIPYAPTVDDPRPYRYLGRSMPLAAWPTTDPETRYLDFPLTAVGYGQPAFAAFYPNCLSVFGFHDPGTGDLTGVAYDVIGWYGGADGNDLLAPLGAEYTAQLRDGHPDAGDAQALVDQFGLDVAIGDPAPTRLACYARIVHSDSAEPEGRTIHGVSVGATGTEALAAWVAGQIAPDRAAEVEDKLEALGLAPDLEHRTIDVGAKFREARHTSDLVPVPGGTRWTVRPPPPSAQEGPVAPELPAGWARLLDRKSVV